MDREELINGYFEGSLSEVQLAEFESLRKTDSEFNTAFEFEKELQLGLKKEERKELKALFSSLDTEDKSIEKDKSKVISIRPWLAAASIALVVGIGSWIFFFQSASIDPNQLYLSNYAPYENVVHPIERGNQMEDLLNSAFLAYEDERYEEALQLFKELNIKQNDAYIEFYEAIVLMQLNRHEESIPLLKNYIEKNGELKDRAYWYLSLSYLKLNRVGNSKSELQKLIQLNSFKTDAAKKLLDDLD